MLTPKFKVQEITPDNWVLFFTNDEMPGGWWTPILSIEATNDWDAEVLAGHKFLQLTRECEVIPLTEKNYEQTT
jgi:hypothetical protein